MNLNTLFIILNYFIDNPSFKRNYFAYTVNLTFLHQQ